METARRVGTVQDKGDMRMRVMLIVGALTLATVAGSTAAEADEAWIDSFAFACTTPEGETLKPKFGDIDGIFYPDLPAQREQCLETIQRKIVHCRDNVDFGSNTKNETYAPCLPIFAEQAEACVGHFIFERSKCDVGGYGTEAAGQAEDEAAPEESHSVAPLDETMEVTTRANVRSGPGTGYDVLDTLDAGVGVRVTGVVEGGKWMRVDLREDGGPAFIHASLLKEVADQAEDEAAPEESYSEAPPDATMEEMAPEAPNAPPEVFGPNWIFAENQPCQLMSTHPVEPDDTVTWWGPCVDGKASGQGRFVWRIGGKDYTYEGGMRNGKVHGHGIMTYYDGNRYEGEWRDSTLHGWGTFTWPTGERYEGGWRAGNQHGRGTYTYADGDAKTCEWRDGEAVDGTCKWH